MPGRVRGSSRPIDLARVRRWGSALFWAVIVYALVAWALALEWR